LDGVVGPFVAEHALIGTSCSLSTFRWGLRRLDNFRLNGSSVLKWYWIVLLGWLWHVVGRGWKRYVRSRWWYGDGNR
jgi:hypothetical protein